MDMVDGLRAFVATAQSGSFTAAAGRLGVSNRLTSKYVAELEARLGVRLLQRTTRKVGITPAGEELLARAPALLEEFDGMISDVTEGTRGFSGSMRISAPVTFGEVYVQEMLRRFAAPHPALVIDLRLDDAYVDLAASGIDLAFRIGEPAVSALKARKLGEVESVVVASPDYLARYGTPQSPDELEGHACIVDTNRRNPARWAFRRGGEELDVQVRGRFSVNSARVARDLALEGFGIAYGPDFVLGEALAAGRLVRLMDGWQGGVHPLSAVYLEGRTLPRKVRALIDFAASDIKSAGVL
ncbi:LysR family transcriptional regulator [Pseudoruegeria sp. HB172150]|uniref:LysR family transcriptional regulator n=1 Tax=Pseudoruegeria sp. HB172150 TaxID=2721164 RepID=UPI001551E2CF|nr:LysR family transcriptional regulator [Pseudoruegeria sp. HB172150]